MCPTEYCTFPDNCDTCCKDAELFSMMFAFFQLLFYNNKNDLKS